MLSYRYFLKQFSLISATEQHRHASTIVDKLRIMGPSLQKFQNLNNKTARFIGNKKKRHRTDGATPQGSQIGVDEIGVITWSTEDPPSLKKTNYSYM